MDIDVEWSTWEKIERADRSKEEWERASLPIWWLGSTSKINWAYIAEAVEVKTLKVKQTSKVFRQSEETNWKKKSIQQKISNNSSCFLLLFFFFTLLWDTKMKRVINFVLSWRFNYKVNELYKANKKFKIYPNVFG